MKIMYKDVGNQTMTPYLGGGQYGIMLPVRGYFCKRRKWSQGISFFFYMT